MMVAQLIEHLRRAPPDALVVVGGDVIHGVELQQGTFETGYFNPVFRSNPRGKHYAVVFLANTELSTGEVVSVPK